MNIKSSYYGDHSLNRLLPLLRALDPLHILIVSGRTAFEKSGARQTVIEELRDFSVTLFQDFQSNPKYEDLFQGLKVFQQTSAEVILSIGGGSAMDMAKCIQLFSRADPKTLMHSIRAQEYPQGPLPTHIAIPTTFGTGSEATSFAVIYLEGKKFSVDDPRLIPHYRIIDPLLGMSLPTHQKACAGLDTLCQAIESYWSVNANSRSQRYARRAIHICVQHLKHAVLTSSHDSIAQMALAAHLAGAAINITRTTAPHALSYDLTHRYQVPHGHAVALLLRAFFYLHENYQAFKGVVTDPRGDEYVQCTMQSVLKAMKFRSLTQAGDYIKDLLLAFNLAHTLEGIGVDNAQQWAEIVSNVNTQRLKNHPIQFPDPKILVHLREWLV